MKSLVQRYGKLTDVYVDNDTKSINIYFNSDFNTEEAILPYQNHKI